MVYKEQEAQKVNKELEYAKKITLIAKLYRKNFLTEKEYEKIRRKLQNDYLII